MKSLGKTTIFDQPAYAASEAASVLQLPLATLKAWSFGQAYRSNAGAPKRFEPVIRAADRDHRLLSFANLCELHVLSAIRRHHKISLPKVRDSVEFLRSRLGSDRPLIDREFKTNGIDLFVEHASKLLNVSRHQEAMRGDFELALARIERDKAGTPVRLFPFSRSSVTDGEQPRAVVIDPRLSFGRPVLARIAVPTEIISDRFRAGDSIPELAEDYRVGEEEIAEAIRFEQRRAA
jgi:uncharacterized protein (DUF433 family)